MILSDRDLKLRLQKGDLVISELSDPELQIQPASIDLRLGNEFLVGHPGAADCIDPRRPESMDVYSKSVIVTENQGFVLQPGDFALGTTEERVEIPADLVAQVDGRSSIGRLAILVHATAGYIDPGFSGQITLELANIGRCPVRLYPKMRICQLVVMTLTSAAERPYGKDRGSQYQGQGGPVGSKFSLD